MTVIRSKTVVLAAENIDTDQIIPARFLTTTTRTGLGRHLFHAWRYDADGRARADFALNAPAASGAEILVAGRNFGCGSSREHAPWALIDYGIKAVISSEIADIFRSNALKNGLLPVELPEEPHRWLLQNPGAPVEIDLDVCAVRYDGDCESSFSIDAFSRHCLMNGFDELAYLLSQDAAISAWEQENAV